jgi:predicted nucleic acid-binding protein
VTVLLDTNLLVRLSDVGDPYHGPASNAVSRLEAAGETLCIVPQCLYEFWAVATRPQANNGLGLTPSAAAGELAGFRRRFRLLDDTPSILPEWERLVVAHSVVGKNGHDARLAAAMLVHGVTHLLTFNDGDFRRFPITVLTPAAILPPGP